MVGVGRALTATTTTEDNALTMRLNEAIASGNDTSYVVEVEVNVRGPDIGDSRSKMEEQARPSLGGSSIMTLLFAPHSSRGRSEWVLI